MIQIKQTFRFFGSISLLFIIGIVSSTDKNLSNISQCTTPIEYNISLEIQNNQFTIVSSVDIDYTCTQQCIRLYIGRYCDIQELHVEPKVPDTFSSHWRTRTSSRLCSTKNRFKSVDISFIEQNSTSFEAKDGKKNREQIITLHEGMKIIPGRYTIYSTYSCHLKEVAIVSTYITKPKNQTEEKIFLILPRIPAEWIFPYWKNPAIKAKFTIKTIQKNTDDTTALSHMLITKIYYSAQNMTYTEFNTTPPISTHLITTAFVPDLTAKYTLLYKVSLRRRVRKTSSALYALSLIQDINRFIRNVWNDSIPRSHYVTYLILPINLTNYETIVTTQLVLFRETDILYDKKIDSMVKQKEVTCLISRSVIQEIFSEWIVTFRQSDIWFIEGFSTVYGVYIHDQLYNTSFLEAIVIQTRRGFLDIEAFIKYDLPIQDTSFIFRHSTLSKLWQEKALSIFYMLSTLFSSNDLLYTSMIKEAVNLYYNTTSNDTYNEQSLFDKLWNFNFGTFLYENTYLDTKLISMIDFKSMILSWTAQIGYPVVQVKRINDEQSLTLTVIDCLNVDQTELCDRKWWIPVILFKITTTKVIFTYDYVLKPYENYTLVIQLKSGNESVIVVNSLGYRVNYDHKSLRNIAFFLKNANITHTDLSDATLAQILEDAFYFLVQNTKYNTNPALNKNDLDTYFDLASSLLRKDKFYSFAWYPLLTALENISKSFLFPQSVVSKHIKDRLLKMLNKFLDDIYNVYDIYSSDNNVNNQLYHEVLKWNCILGGLKCTEHVTKKLQWHFNDTAKHKLLPSLQKWMYCQGLIVENVTYDKSVIWQKLLIMYTRQSKETELYEFLSCSRVSENVFKSIYMLSEYRLSLYGPIAIRKKSDSVTFLFDIVAKHSKQVNSLISILHRIELIRRDFNIIALVSCIINNIYSDEGLWMITDEKFLQQLTNTDNMPLFVLDAIKEKVVNRRRLLAKMQVTYEV